MRPVVRLAGTTRCQYFVAMRRVQASSAPCFSRESTKITSGTRGRAREIIEAADANLRARRKIVLVFASTTRPCEYYANAARGVCILKRTTAPRSRQDFRALLPHSIGSNDPLRATAPPGIPAGLLADVRHLWTLVAIDALSEIHPSRKVVSMFTDVAGRRGRGEAMLSVCARSQRLLQLACSGGAGWGLPQGGSRRSLRARLLPGGRRQSPGFLHMHTSPYPMIFRLTPPATDRVARAFVYADDALEHPWRVQRLCGGRKHFPPVASPFRLRITIRAKPTALRTGLLCLRNPRYIRHREGSHASQTASNAQHVLLFSSEHGFHPSPARVGFALARLDGTPLDGCIIQRQFPIQRSHEVVSRATYFRAGKTS